MSSSEPLAVYRERLLSVSRVLELYSDRVVVRAKWLMGKSYRSTISLENLKSQPVQFWTRQRIFKRVLGFSLLAAAGAVVLSRPGVTPAPLWITYLLYGAAVFFGGLSAMTFPKVLFARFSSREGKPGLDIARAGPDAARFEEFVERIRGRIKKS